MSGAVVRDGRRASPARQARHRLIALFACLQRYFFRGVGEGAVKG
ncbi:hypothetical protein [Streptomyces sp. NBC_00557]|nr:hypothetical protein [Streptomyces sp. NBC_00557]WUC33427.1 hypothetical protein OG956_04000 [Streptomyces sp. NBC_00557]